MVKVVNNLRGDKAHGMFVFYSIIVNYDGKLLIRYAFIIQCNCMRVVNLNRESSFIENNKNTIII
jgi:hypothetical protein